MIEFEWDENKNQENIKKHDGISFQEATKVFDDLMGVDLDDTQKGEFRLNRIGFADFKLLHVSYIWKGDKIRIISARRAEPHEERLYAETNS